MRLLNGVVPVLMTVVVGLSFSPPAHALDTTILHSFMYGLDDGRNPYGSPTLSGSTLYGMTVGGGSQDGGTLFRVETDGTDYRILRSFVGGSTDGLAPAYSRPTVSGSTIYGVTWYGGTSNSGTIFKVGTDGGDFGLLYSFRGTGGYAPQSTLVLDGSTLYGTAGTGGASNKGTIFKIGADGSGFTVLHAFAGGPADGDTAYGSLTLDGSILYGMTLKGGAYGYGSVYKIGTDGTGFTLLHSFTGGSDGGDSPYGGLVVVDSTLYGMTSNWATGTKGTLFRMSPDGTGFGVLHAFVGGDMDGRFPQGTLSYNGSALYGLTVEGGANDRGTVFQIGTDGSGFTVLHSFLGERTDGARPYGDLAIDASTLYGMTYTSGTGGWGTVYSLTVPEPSVFVMLGVALASLVAWRLRPKGRQRSPRCLRESFAQRA